LKNTIQRGPRQVPLDRLEKDISSQIPSSSSSRNTFENSLPDSAGNVEKVDAAAEAEKEKEKASS
jgi:hypothetical protein